MLIKKLNSVFHRHSRWVFGLFTIIIIVSFIGFMVPGSFFGFTPNGGGSVVGTAFGSKVTYEDLREINRALQICAQIGFPVGEPRIEQQFVFLCMLKEAERLGLAASDAEVSAALQRHPMLQTNGKFDMEKYRKFTAGLERYGISKADVQNSLRKLLVLDKLQQHTNSGTVVTPGEAKELYRQLNTAYQIQIAEAVVAKPGKLVKPDAKSLKDLDAKETAAVQKYFSINSKNYLIPGYFSVLAVEFRSALFEKTAGKAVTPAMLEKYYETRKMLFAGKDGKAPALKTIQPKVLAEFVKERSAELAQRAAEDFSYTAAEAVSTTDSPADKLQAFRKAAAKLNLTVVEAGKVGFNDYMIGSLNAPGLVREFGTLAGNPVTKAVAGANGSFVGFLRSRVDTRPAKLEEVLAQVRLDCINAELRKAAAKELEAKYTALRKLPKAQQGKAFAALKGIKLDTVDFTLSKPPMDSRFQQAVISSLSMTPGDITAPMPNLQMVRLVSRKAPDFKEFKGKEAQFMMIVRMRKQQQAGMAFMEYLNANCKLDPAVTGAER